MKTKIVSIITLLAFLLSSCAHPVTTSDGGLGIPIKLATPSYPINIFYATQVVPEPTDPIGPVKVEREVELTKEEMKQKRMLNRGNDEDQKRALLDQLVIQAIGMGAQAIINVKYKYYTAATYQGFILEGTAVKYKVEGN